MANWAGGLARFPEMQETMEGEPWNRINVIFPSAASTVRIKFTPSTATVLKQMLLENKNVLKLIHSSSLQTEIRDLNEQVDQQLQGQQDATRPVKQCVNRLKNMKLCTALQDLADLCPSKSQMALYVNSSECNVPSQPMLEWICLIARCSRAFLFSKQHMNLGEFISLNLVLTSMLNRLGVIFRGILVGLSHLYQKLLELLKKVAQAQPMPYLTDFSLPADMAAFLGPSDALLLEELNAFASTAKMEQQPKKAPAKDVNQQQTRRRTKRKTVRLRSRLQSLKTRFVLSKIRAGVKKRRMKRQQKEDAAKTRLNREQHFRLLAMMT